MRVRGSMAALITGVRVLINDTLPVGSGQIFDDQTVQNVLDESRLDLYNQPLVPQWTYSGSTPQVLDYFAPSQWGDWEDDIVLKQYLTVVVTPASTDDIVGHWSFTASTLPPVFITGKTFDIYRSAADLLERWAARYALRFNSTAEGQTLHLEGASTQLLNLARRYRLKQPMGVTTMSRSDMRAQSGAERDGNLLGAKPIDYMSSG